MSISLDKAGIRSLAGATALFELEGGNTTRLWLSFEIAVSDAPLRALQNASTRQK